MTELYRVRSAWTGFIGGPGVSTMYFLDVATAVASVHTFWTDILAKLPSDVHIQVENSGDIIDDATGDMTGAWSSDAVAVVNGTDSGEYAAPCGACVNWLTEDIAAGRRLRGRTFVVPLAAGAFQADGSINNTFLALLQSSADALIAAQSTSFVVWHRGTGTDGSNGLITASKVNDRVAVLTSRRD